MQQQKNDSLSISQQQELIQYLADTVLAENQGVSPDNKQPCAQQNYNQTQQIQTENFQLNNGQTRPQNNQIYGQDQQGWQPNKNFVYKQKFIPNTPHSSNPNSYVFYPNQIFNQQNNVNTFSNHLNNLPDQFNPSCFQSSNQLVNNNATVGSNFNQVLYYYPYQQQQQLNATTNTANANSNNSNSNSNNNNNNISLLNNNIVSPQLQTPQPLSSSPSSSQFIQVQPFTLQNINLNTQKFSNSTAQYQQMPVPQLQSAQTKFYKQEYDNYGESQIQQQLKNSHVSKIDQSTQTTLQIFSCEDLKNLAYTDSDIELLTKIKSGEYTVIQKKDCSQQQHNSITEQVVSSTNSIKEDVSNKDRKKSNQSDTVIHNSNTPTKNRKNSSSETQALKKNSQVKNKQTQQQQAEKDGDTQFKQQMTSQQENTEINKSADEKKKQVQKQIEKQKLVIKEKLLERANSTAEHKELLIKQNKKKSSMTNSSEHTDKQKDLPPDPIQPTNKPYTQQDASNASIVTNQQEQTQQQHLMQGSEKKRIQTEKEMATQKLICLKLKTQQKKESKPQINPLFSSNSESSSPHIPEAQTNSQQNNKANLATTSNTSHSTNSNKNKGTHSKTSTANDNQCSINENKNATINNHSQTKLIKNQSIDNNASNNSIVNNINNIGINSLGNSNSSLTIIMPKNISSSSNNNLNIGNSLSSKLLKFEVDSAPIQQQSEKLTLVNNESSVQFHSHSSYRDHLQSQVIKYKVLGQERMHLTQNKNLQQKMDQIHTQITEEKDKTKNKLEEDNSSSSSNDSESKSDEEGYFQIDLPTMTRYYMPNVGKICFRCKKQGHILRNCPLQAENICLYCLGPHLFQNCDCLSCFACGQMGHLREQCGYFIQKSSSSQNKCLMCLKRGHEADQCQVLFIKRFKEEEYKKFKGLQQCLNCQKFGHINCNKRPISDDVYKDTIENFAHAVRKLKKLNPQYANNGNTNYNSSSNGNYNTNYNNRGGKQPYYKYNQNENYYDEIDDMANLEDFKQYQFIPNGNQINKQNPISQILYYNQQ